MTNPPSRLVSSDQTSIHENLHGLVTKHLNSNFKRPYAPHNIAAFEQAMAQWDKRPLIFDSGCGTGESTRWIAAQHPSAFVIGIDKSQHRLNKAEPRSSENTVQNEQVNYIRVRADLLDFWRLATDNGIKLNKHYILYPNPWPKKAHLQRRWHGSPVFKNILSLGGDLELRTNWQLYAEEMHYALNIANRDAEVQAFAPNPQNYASNFEKKYALCGQTLWKLQSSSSDTE